MKSPSFGSVVLVLCLIVFPVSTALGAAPNDPTNLTGAALSTTKIQLNWVDNSTDETAFRIERSPDGVSFSPLGTVSANTTKFDDATVAPDTLYYYRVIAESPAGDSKPSNILSMFTLDSVVPQAPVLTSPPNGDQLDTQSVRFEWNPVSDMSGVTYRIVVNDLGNGITLHDVSGITSNNISLLCYDSYYEWTVSATDGAGNESPPSDPYYLAVLAFDHMAPDTVVTAPNGGEELQGDGYFAITWYALDQDFTSTPQLKVFILFSRDNGDHWEEIVHLDNNPGAFNWHVPNILCEATCLIRVITENEAGMLGSDDSDFAFSITPSASAPAIAEAGPVAGGGGGGCTIAGARGDWKDGLGSFGALVLTALVLGLRRCRSRA